MDQKTQTIHGGSGCNSSTQEAEARGPYVLSQPGLHQEIPPQTNNTNTLKTVAKAATPNYLYIKCNLN